MIKKIKKFKHLPEFDSKVSEDDFNQNTEHSDDEVSDLHVTAPQSIRSSVHSLEPQEEQLKLKK